MTKKTTKKTKVKPIESTYTKQEIIDASDAFGETPEVVAGALKLVDKKDLAKAEVESAIRKFKTRKVH